MSDEDLPFDKVVLAGIEEVKAIANRVERTQKEMQQTLVGHSDTLEEHSDTLADMGSTLSDHGRTLFGHPDSRRRGAEPGLVQVVNELASAFRDVKAVAKAGWAMLGLVGISTVISLVSMFIRFGGG